MRISADFETTTNKEDCRIWAYSHCEIGNPSNITYGNDINKFMEYAKNSNNSTFYFHNLKFDGEFIIIWLFEHGFKHVTDRKDLDSKTFTTLISNKGIFYSMKIVFEKQGKRTKFITIYDSLKILPFSVEQIAKGFHLPISKLELDYNEYREKGHELTQFEINYIKNDVTIVALALDTIFQQGLEQMTQGSNALYDYKRTVTKNKFDKWFPIPDYDHDVRQSYKGGFTYVNPKFQGVDIKKGIVLDVNSLYPWAMRNKPLPYGEGIYFEGEYKNDSLYNLYVQMFTCQFEIKPNHIPTVQLKNTLTFIPTEYLTSSRDDEITLCMTNVDLKLFLEHYNVYNIEYHSGWKFKSSTMMFVDYIDKWSNEKIKAKQEDNYAMYILSKLMLNSLYGKFALNPNVQSKIPYYDDGMIKYRDGEKETRDPIYIPVGTFVTAWARDKTIRTAQSVYDRFMYADTDSLHLIGTEMPDIEIDDYRLGAWKHESTFIRARYLRQKSYFETIIINDKEFNKMEEKEKEKCYILEDVRVKDKITCSGMQESCYQYVTWENFHEGAIYNGKLQAKHVRGGIVLADTTFEIKPK